jgi:sugar phosphate isomerase/epimerase
MPNSIIEGDGYLIGINLPGTNLAGVENALRTISEDGFQACEINLSTLPFILYGDIKTEVVSFTKAIMEKYDLVYTAHASYGLDLRNVSTLPLHQKVLNASVMVCSMLGIDRLNVHFEEHSPVAEQEQLFFESIIRAADLGQDLDVAVNVENIEVEDARLALDAVKRVNHPNCKMTLDLGHLYISANYFGYDYFKTLQDCLPYLGHLHINDNYGVFEPMRMTNKPLYDTLDKGSRFTFGLGDIHIPPFWGSVPIAKSLKIIRDSGYRGIWLCEYYSDRFSPFNHQVYTDVLSCLRNE